MTIGTNTPVVDVLEQDSEYVLYLDMPGVNKEDLSISVERNVLSIKGNHKADQDKTAYSYQEYKPKNYGRTFKLSADVDHNNIDAALNDGVLTLTLKKLAEAQAQHITIN